MQAQNINTSIIKRESSSLLRVSRAIEITNKLLGPTEEPFLIPYRKGNKWGFCDKTKKISIPCVFEDVALFSEGLAAVKVNGKLGFIDNSGNTIVPCIYERVNHFHEGLSAVQRGNEWGFIDNTGKEIIPFIYFTASSFNEGFSFVSKDRKFGFIDKSGKGINNFWEEERKEFWEDNRWRFLSPHSFSEGLACVKHFNKRITNKKDQGGNYDIKVGFIDKTGREVVPCIYDDIDIMTFQKPYFFSEGLAAVRYQGAWGFIDKTEIEIIPYIYDSAYFFSEGLSAVLKDDDKWGFIDKTEIEIIPYIYDEVDDFSKGLAAVEFNGKKGFIDKRGNEFWED